MKQRTRIEKSVGLSLIFSLAIHAVIGLILMFQNVDALKKLTQSKEPAVVELVDAEKFLKAMGNVKHVSADHEGQIVQQDEKALNEETPENTRFLSAHNQKVIQQTQAMVNGKFKNSDSTGGEKHEKKQIGKNDETPQAETEKTAERKAEQETKEILTSEDGVDVHSKTAKMKNFMPSFRPTAPQVNAPNVATGGGEGPSTTDDRLKDVKTGMETVLSTKEFLYYTYYNRIRSKLTQYWQPKIREKMERIMKQGRTIASTGDKITRIVIILDDKGTLRKVQVLGASGVTDLDDAAVEAFRAAAPFPNPPKGMVDRDGTIKIRWDFVLEA